MKKLIAVLMSLFFLGVSFDASAQCGKHGGPGWRKPDGQCASWADGPNPHKIKKHHAKKYK